MACQARRTQLITHESLKSVAYPSQQYAVTVFWCPDKRHLFTLGTAYHRYPSKRIIAIHRSDGRVNSKLPIFFVLNSSHPDLSP